jgi:hypothetical protein
MKWKIAVVLFISLLSGQAKAHHKYGHQNDTPQIDQYSWDCEKLSNYIQAQRHLFILMFKHKLEPTKDDIDKYNKSSGIYRVVCREV